MRIEMPWECYHISKPISALKYTNVNAKLYSSMWWNYSSFYNNRCKLGTWRWGPWLQGKWGFGCRVRASCELAAGGAGTAGAHLTPWELPSAEALPWGPARAAAPLRRSPACPWPWATGADLPALPCALDGVMGWEFSWQSVIMLSSRLPLLISDNKCG